MKTSLRGVIESDLASRINSGVPVKLTPDLQNYYGTQELSYDFVANKLGEGEAIKWEQDKARADRFYSAGANMKEMPEQQIYERLRSLAPKDGSPDYQQQIDVYNHALKEKDKVLADREKDPALAVQNLSGVKAAYEAYLKDPSLENGQKLAAARMEGQKYLGIDEAIWTPLTNAEGSRIAKGFSGKGSLNPAETAGGAVARLQSMLGGNEDYMKRALATVGRQQGVNEAGGGAIKRSVDGSAEKTGRGGQPNRGAHQSGGQTDVIAAHRRSNRVRRIWRDPERGSVRNRSGGRRRRRRVHHRQE